jgi:hypothetical protein
MKLTTTEKIDLVAAIGKMGINTKNKTNEFEMFGTFVVSANKSLKKKLDVILEDVSDKIKVSEFDDNMWRITDIDTTLNTIQSGREIQCH